MQTKMEQIRDDLGEAFRGEIKDFAAWAEANWKLHRERDAGPDSGMTPEEIDGWNKCVRSLKGALEGWLGEGD